MIEAIKDTWPYIVFIGMPSLCYILRCRHLEAKARKEALRVEIINAARRGY